MSVKGGTTQKNSGVASVPLNLQAPPTPSYTFPLTTQEEKQTMQVYQHWLSEQQQNIESMVDFDICQISIDVVTVLGV